MLIKIPYSDFEPFVEGNTIITVNAVEFEKIRHQVEKFLESPAGEYHWGIITEHRTDDTHKIEFLATSTKIPVMKQYVQIIKCNV